MADPRWAWRVATDPAAIAALADTWNAMAEPLSPLADATWSQCMAAAFADPSTTPPTIHALYDGDRLAAVLPLRRRYLPWRVWEALQNEHNPYWQIATAAPSLAMAREILAHLLADAEYLLFTRLHLDGPMAQFLVEAAGAGHLKTSVIPNRTGHTYLTIKRPWTEFRAARSKKLMQDVPRKLRQLEKLGPVTMETITDPDLLEPTMTGCFEIEQKGWKGVSGAPIKSGRQTLRFYTDLARQMAARGRFSLCVLKLGGRIIAFEYWLRGGGHIEQLKISFDPEFGKFSPGDVLRYLALQAEVESGHATFFNMGPPYAWKLRWTDTVHTLGSFRCYAPTLAGTTAFLTGPVLRRTLKQRFGGLHARWTKLREAREK